MHNWIRKVFFPSFSCVYRKHRDVLAESISPANDDTASVEKSSDGNECFSYTMPSIELEHTISHLDYLWRDNSLRYSLCLENYETLYFDSHFNGYVIEPSSTSFISFTSSLPSHPTLHSHKAFTIDQKYLSHTLLCEQLYFVNMLNNVKLCLY